MASCGSSHWTGWQMYSRRVISFLLFMALSAHCLYTDPPVSNATAHNFALAPELNSSYDPAIGRGGNVSMVFYGTDINWAPISRRVEMQLINASMRLLSVEPSVDSATHAGSGSALLFAWGDVASQMQKKDWEGDDCAEYQLGSTVSRSALLNFSFGNTSAVVNVTDNLVLIPDAVLGAMARTTGGDILRVRANATFLFTYEVDDRRPSHEEGCSHHPANFTSVMNIVDEMNWTVEGDRALFFLRAPLLGEQWFRDNHFDTVLFSNSRIYRASVSANGNQTRSFRLYGFNITNDSYGLWHVVSVPLAQGDAGAASHAALTTPSPISDDNSTYGYVSEFNYTYGGLGTNTLALEAVDVFGGRHAYSREILSRMLSHSGNTTELGGPVDPSIARRSEGFGAGSIGTVTLSLGMVGLLAVVLLANRIAGK